MTITIPESLFHLAIILNVTLVVVLTVIVFIREMDYKPTTFICLILLLWGVPIVGVIVAMALIITNDKTTN